MNNDKILLIGGGGHCKSIIDTIESSNLYNTIKIVDKEYNIGKYILSHKIIGEDSDLIDLYKEGYTNAFISVGSVGNPKLRIRLQKLIKTIGYKIPNIIDDTSILSKNITLGEGIFIGKKSIINVDVTIGDGSIVNSGSIIEHDCEIGKFVHVAPGSVVSGGVKIGDGTHIGVGSSIKQNVNIGSNSIIGMGSVVISDIDDNKIAYGNPCKEVT